MSEHLIQSETLTAIADAIRGKTGGTAKLTPEQMAAAVAALQMGIDTSDATAAAAQILSGYTAYVKDAKVTGSMVDRAAVNKKLDGGGSYTIPAGYHNGGGKVTNAVSGIAKCQLVTITTTESAKTLTINHSLGVIPQGFIILRKAPANPTTSSVYHVQKVFREKSKTPYAHVMQVTNSSGGTYYADTNVSTENSAKIILSNSSGTSTTMATSFPADTYYCYLFTYA